MPVLRSSRDRSRVAVRHPLFAHRAGDVARVVTSRRTAVLVTIVALSSIAACKESTDPPRVASLSGLNTNDSVRIGKTLQMLYELRDAKGNRITGRQVTWTSLNTSAATVDANGLVTGVGTGFTTITGRVDDATSSTLMQVQPPVTTVLVLPATNTIPLQGTKTLAVAMTDKDGLTVGGRAISFSSSNPGIATVNASGTVVGVALGTATISATSLLDAVSGSATVQIVPVSVASVSITPAGSHTVFQGLTLQLSATTRDGTGTILNGRQVNWTTSNAAVATVTAGLVTAVGLGTAQITAESEGVTGSVQISVTPRPVATVTVSPNPASVKLGTAFQMSLDLRDENGNQLTTVGRSVSWDSSNKPVATVQDGVVLGHTSGTATITATVDGRTGSAIVNVAP